METTGKKEHALQIFRAAVDAVHPSKVIPSYLSLNGDRFLAGENIFSFSQFENIHVAGSGKASAAMAFEAENILHHHIEDGVIVVRDEFPFILKHVRMIYGGHPLPDTNSVIAAQEITKLLNKIHNEIIAHVKSKLADLGAVVVTSSPEDFQKYIRRETGTAVCHCPDEVECPQPADKGQQDDCECRIARQWKNDVTERHPCSALKPR